MKCYAMMYRKTIKDAVDLYYILQNGYTLEQLLNETKKIFTILYKPEYTCEALLSKEWDMSETIDRIGDHPSYEEVFEWLSLQAQEYMQKILK